VSLSTRPSIAYPCSRYCLSWASFRRTFFICEQILAGFGEFVGPVAAPSRPQVTDGTSPGLLIEWRTVIIFCRPANRPRARHLMFIDGFGINAAAMFDVLAFCDESVGRMAAYVTPIKFRSSKNESSLFWNSRSRRDHPHGGPGTCE
jgi:hypothetical protein